jgi:hypothetical protein
MTRNRGNAGRFATGLGEQDELCACKDCLAARPGREAIIANARKLVRARFKRHVSDEGGRR